MPRGIPPKSRMTSHARKLRILVTGLGMPLPCRVRSSAPEDSPSSQWTIIRILGPSSVLQSSRTAPLCRGTTFYIATHSRTRSGRLRPNVTRPHPRLESKPRFPQFSDGLMLLNGKACGSAVCSLKSAFVICKDGNERLQGLIRRLLSNRAKPCTAVEFNRSILNERSSPVPISHLGLSSVALPMI
jgi:hypothetical protein